MKVLPLTLKEPSDCTEKWKSSGTYWTFCFGTWGPEMTRSVSEWTWGNCKGAVPFGDGGGRARWVREIDYICVCESSAHKEIPPALALEDSLREGCVTASLHGVDKGAGGCLQE